MNKKQRKAPTGILGFPVTPMDKDGKIDYRAFEKNLEFLMEEGLRTIFIACGAGELQSINMEEYRELIKVAFNKTKGKAALYTGVGGNIEYALEQARISEELGAEGYLILPPYLIDPSQDGIYNYLKEIIGSTQLNAIVYQRDKCVLEAETLMKLCELPQLVAFKDGVGNMEINIELTHLLGDRLEFINGMPLAEVTIASYVNIGFTSYSSAISNYIPHISAMYYEALLNGNKQLVHDLYKDVIFPIHRIRKKKEGYAVSLIKAGMNIVGLPVNLNVRPPVAPVEPEHYDELKKIIENALTKYPKSSKVI